MQDFQIQQKIKMEESSKRKSPEKAEDGFGIELDSQNDVLNSLNNEEYQPGDTKAIYAMKELKVPVNPRYLLNSRMMDPKCATNAVSPRKRRDEIEFADLNLHKLNTAK